MRPIRPMADVDALSDDQRANPAGVVLGLARAKLRRPVRRQPLWRLLGAAAFLAVTSLGLAAVIILGPPVPQGDRRPVEVNPWVR